MKRRFLSAMLSVVMAASLVTGCAGSSSGTADTEAEEVKAGDTKDSGGTGTGNKDTQAASGEQVTLTVMDGYAPEDPHGQYIYQYAEEFMKENPDIKVEIQAIASGDIYTKLAAMATSPDDLPTMFFTSADQVPTLYDLGLTEDLNNWMDKEAIDGLANGVMDASNNSSGQSRFMSYLWRNGYELAYQEDGSDEWKTDITTDPAFVDVFSKWTDMNNVEGVVPTGITEVDYPTAANYFAMGYTSMFLTGPNALGVAYANNPELKGKLGSFKLPGEYSGTMLGAEGYAITAKSTDAEKAAAAKYLAFFTSHDKDMKFWESSGKIPSTTEGQKVSYITGDDYAGFLKQIEDGCRPTLAFAGISGLKSALGDAYAAVFSNEKTNDQAVEQLVKDLDQLLEDYN